MKLKNKKTGEIVNAMEVDLYTDAVYLKISKDGRYDSREYGSLAELNAEWEDYEEPKEYWTIDWTCTGVTTNKYSGDDVDDFNKSIGNYFETEEEAEKAVEKLKAWKRLKDKGFINEQVFSMNLNWCDPDEDDYRAFHLLFGGEE